MGSNTVRTYHSIGEDMKTDHGRFLDYAHFTGLDVMPGYHTYICPNHNCFENWRKATHDAFNAGYSRGRKWHSAISTLIILDVPDYLGSAEERVRMALSAFDGVLTAEKEAGVEAGRVLFAVSWSFANRASLDGTV